MEAKFLASVFSFLSIFLAIYAQSNADNSGELDYKFESAIYYGDSNVNLGEPFSITCIILVTEPIFWVKNGEPIALHNLRHGKDEHSYIRSESEIEGEKHKIEAHISVRHALKVHEGKYQCNQRHSSFHMLHVRSPVEPPRPHTKSPFIITAQDNQLPTESGYETIQELSPSTDNDIFTRTWDPLPPVWPPPREILPTQRAHTPATTHQHRVHQHHHHQQATKEHDKHKFIYINATNFDGNPASSGSQSNENMELINLEYMPPTSKYGEVTTIPGRTTGYVDGHRQRQTYPPPPDFPPPRTTTWYSTKPPMQYYNPHPHINPNERQYVSTNTAITTADSSEEEQPPYVPYPQPPFQSTYRPQRPTPMQTAYQPAMTPYSTQTPQNPRQHHRPATHQPHAPMVAKSKEPEFLVPNYDNNNPYQIKTFDISKALVLFCNITKEGTWELKWEKNGTDVREVKSLENRFKILKEERKFIIEKAYDGDAGIYSCVVDNYRKDFNVVAKVQLRVPSNINVVEGERLSIVCTVVGTDPQLSWIIGNETLYNTTGRYILKPNDNRIQNAILEVENMTVEDRGKYFCVAKNDANKVYEKTEASDYSYVRVKGKFAALWPFLGICLEVLILCAIILVYEKRRNKTELEESDTDPQEQKKKRRNYD